MIPAVTASCSRRIAAVQPPMIPVVGEMIARHQGTISLGQGVVHYGPPPQVAEAVTAALADAAVNRYGRVGGIDPLLERLHAKLRRDNGVAVGEARRVLVTAGGNMAFLNALLAITEPGDEVILPLPWYFNHEMAITMCGCRAVGVPCDADHQLDLQALRDAVSSRTRAIVTVSPNNPTGAVYRPDDLRAVNRLCAERGLYHISDEAYEYFTYGEAVHRSPLSFDDAASHTIGLYSLSKTYGMAGWRLGYQVVPAHLEEALRKIQDTNLICPPIVSQVAAGAALDAGPAWIRERTASLAPVRDLVLDGLAALGRRVVVPRPDGAFYVLLRVRTRSRDLALVERLIAEHRVAVMPGSTFGIAGGCSLRIAYGALDGAAVGEAMGRLVTGLAALVPEEGEDGCA